MKRLKIIALAALSVVNCHAILDENLQPKDAETLLADIVEQSEIKYPGNYSLQNTYLKVESEAVQNIISFAVENAKDRDMVKILAAASIKFPKSYNLQWVYIKTQVEAYHKVRRIKSQIE